MSDHSYSNLPVRNRPRQRYSTEFKRQVVEQTIVANSSAASVALSHGINANLLLRWRREYLQGAFGPVAQPVLLPVHISSAAAVPDSAESASEKPQIDYIELRFESTLMRIWGRPDDRTLRCVIEALRT